ncbi:MAG: hypothetical protein IKC80_08135 [Kiritimatiellae bacterium]|nr:hypothetical protein [Kiritimatiellia bacterium]
MMYRLMILSVAALFSARSLYGAVATIEGNILTVEVSAEDGSVNFAAVDGYAAALEALSGNTVSDFRKTGMGKLVVGDDLSAYKGDFHIDEGTYSFTAVGACGAYKYSSEKGKTYVADGATLDNALAGAVSGSVSYRELHFRGTGVDGNGALTVSSSFEHTNRSTWSEYLVMDGDALISDLTCPNAQGCNIVLFRNYPQGDFYSRLDMNSHKLTVKMKGAGAKDCMVTNEGRVINAGDIDLYGAVWYSKDYVTYNDVTSEDTMFVGPGSGIKLYNSRGTSLPFKLVYGGDETSCGIQFVGGDTTSGRRKCSGPVELQTTMPITISQNTDGTLSGAISGPGGISLTAGKGAKLYLANSIHDGVSTELADCLRVNSGNVTFRSVTPGLATAGLIAGRRFAASWDELKEDFYSDTTAFTNIVQTGFNAANVWTDPLWFADEGEATGPQMLVTYSGFVCNTSSESVKWSFLLCCVSKARLIVGTDSITQENYKEAQKMTLDLPPGRHRVLLKIYSPYKPSNVSDPGGGPASSPTNVVKVSYESVGLKIDTKGRDSWNLSDYSELKNGNDKYYFHWNNGDPSENVIVHPITGHGVYDVFSKLSVLPGTSLTFESPVMRQFETVEGFTAMTGGGGIIIKDGWNIDAGRLKGISEGEGGWTTDGKVVFEKGAKIRITGVPHRKTSKDPDEIVILNAQGGVFGEYEVEMDEEVADRWRLSTSDDGKRLMLIYKPRGMKVLVR